MTIHSTIMLTIHTNKRSPQLHYFSAMVPNLLLVCSTGVFVWACRYLSVASNSTSLQRSFGSSKKKKGERKMEATA